MKNRISDWQALTPAKRAWVVFTMLLMCSHEDVKGDEAGILRKAIPERLIALTFDDGCASHATVAAPLLKKLEFNATFYVVKPGTFSPRRSWYVKQNFIWMAEVLSS